MDWVEVKDDLTSQRWIRMCPVRLDKQRAVLHVRAVWKLISILPFAMNFKPSPFWVFHFRTIESLVRKLNCICWTQTWHCWTAFLENAYFTWNNSELTWYFCHAKMDIPSKWILFEKFHEDWTKIVDFILSVNFLNQFHSFFISVVMGGALLKSLEGW